MKYRCGCECQKPPNVGHPSDMDCPSCRREAYLKRMAYLDALPGRTPPPCDPEVKGKPREVNVVKSRHPGSRRHTRPPKEDEWDV
jgi:hypothetical protein